MTLIDEALPPRHFARLARAIRRLGTERLRTSYETTFWFPLGAPPTNVVEEAVIELRRFVPGLQGIVGVEWWLSRMYTSNVQVDFHVDRDNALFARTGRTVSPPVSSLLYLNRCRGGLLAVTSEPANDANPALAPDVQDFDFATPAPNRFVHFPGRLTHGVLDANNELPGRRLPRERTLRLAIAINWWQRPPLDVPRWTGSRAYRRLAPTQRGKI